MLARLAVVMFLTIAASAQRVAEGPEPNESTATATPLPCGGEAFGEIAMPADRDWYRVSLTAPSSLWIETAPDGANEIGDTVVTLLDSSGGPLQRSDDAIGRGFYSQLFVEQLAAGSYYVAVESGSAGASTGGYQLDLRCRALSAPVNPTIYSEGAENNDPRSGGTAASVFVPARCDGTLQTTGFDGDWDFFRFLLFGDSIVRLQVDATASHPAAAVASDPVIYLFDGATPPNVVAGPIHASDRDMWDQVWEARLPGGLYQLAVRGWAGSGAGSYYVDITARQTATGQVLAGGCGGRMLDLATTSIGPGAPLVLERAAIGTTYSAVGRSLGSFGFGFFAVGFSSTLVNLTPLGAPGCTLEVSFVNTVFQQADASGRAVWSIPIPENPTLLGTTIESQVAVFDLSNALGITLSNRVSAVVAD